MAIYLDEMTRPYLERLINKQVEKSENDFVAKMIQGKLKSDRDRLEVMGKCEHVKGKYTGHKDCCTKCGSFYEAGMGEEWTLIIKDKKNN